MSASRREFLTRAVTAGVGVSVLEPFGLSAAYADDSAMPTASAADPNDADPNFFYGTIVGVPPDGALRGVDDLNAAWVLQVTPGSAIWREGETGNALPVVGDHLSARGQRGPDGTLRIDTAWANIVKFDGWLREVAPGGALTIDSDQQGAVGIGFTDLTTVVDPSGRSLAGASPALLKVGGDVTAIGWRTAEGTFQASRVIMPPDPAVVAAQAEAVSKLAVAHAAAITVQYAGVASYFTCNGAACGTCHTSSHQLAWPKMNGNLCGPSHGCDLPANWPSHSCSACFDAQNGCQTGTVRLKVADCGPNTRCRKTGCLSYQDVWFDLTQGAFTALGGSLSIGHLDLQLSAAFSC
jgi:hypothetical protein